MGLYSEMPIRTRSLEPGKLKRMLFGAHIFMCLLIALEKLRLL